MNITVSSSDLLRSALTVQKAMPAKSTDPILENFLFVLDGSRLEITGSDNEITIKTELDVSNVEEGGSMVAPHQLTDLLKEIPDQPITIKTLSDNSFKCVWAGGDSVLPCFNPDDYPESKKLGTETHTIAYDTDVLAESIGSTIYAASDEANRPMMNSIFFDVKDNDTTFVASDLQKLVCYNTTAVKSTEPCSMILSSRHASVIKSTIGKEKEEVTVEFDGKTAVFSYGQTRVICSLLSGKYPDYNTIIPNNNTNILTINRQQFLSAVRRISVCSPKASSCIKFTLGKGLIDISAQDLGFEIAGQEKVNCQYDGDDLSIGFKSTHIIDILSNFESENVIVKFADKRRTALFLPDGDTATGNKVFAIVMPIMVR